MSEHTKPPWDATTHPHHAPGMRPDLEEQYTLSETDFRRASACVNALADMDPHAVVAVLTHIREWADEMSNAREDASIEELYEDIRTIQEDLDIALTALGAKP